MLENMRGIDAAAITGCDWLDVLVRTLPAFCLLITFLIAVLFLRVRVRELHDLCGRDLGGRRVLCPPEVNIYHADRSRGFQQPSRVNTDSKEQQNSASRPSEKESVRRKPSGVQWERSLPFRPRAPSSKQATHFHPSKRALPVRSTFKGTEAQSQNISFPDLSSYFPESHRSEADDLYGNLPSSTIRGLRMQTSAEIPRQFLGASTEPSGDGAWETLDTLRAVSDRKEGGDDSGGSHTSDEDLEHEDFDGTFASMVGTMRASGVAAAERSGGPNDVRHALRRRARRAHLRGGGGDDFDPSGAAHISNIKSCSDDEGVVGEDEEGVCIEDPPFQYDPYEDDATVGLSRHPGDQLRPTRGSAPSDELGRRLRPRAAHPDVPLLTVHQNEIIEDADPSISISQRDQVPAVGASWGSPLLQSAQPPTVLFSAEVAEECDDILGDLDATYGHIALAQRKLNELLQRAGVTERPLLRQIILSHNELHTREMELATLKTYVARMRATVDAPNEGLLDEILDFIEVEDDRRTRSRRDDGGHAAAAGNETVVGQSIPPAPSRRPWGWKPNLKAHHHHDRRRKPSIEEEKDNKEDRQYRPSDLSRPGQTSRDEGPSQPSPARPYYRQPEELERKGDQIQELDGTQIIPRPTNSRRHPRRRRGSYSSHRSSSSERGSETDRSHGRRTAIQGPNMLSWIRARRIPVAADMVGTDLYDVIARIADETSGMPSVSQRGGGRGRSGGGGGGGGPWPWPGPGGPIPDPVAPPYA